MNAVNYQKQLEQILLDIRQKQIKPRLMLHSCCAPCSSYCLMYLAPYFEITVLYFNPNIYPQQEFIKRAAEEERLIKELNQEYGFGITFTEGSYEPEKFFELAKGLEDVAEGGERCFRCYEQRLREAAVLAKEGGFDYFTTTLSISPLKNAAKLNEIGEKVGAELGIRHLPADFKKKEGYKQSIALSKKYGLYRQNYCGCVYSRRAEDAEDALSAPARFAAL